MQYERIMYDSYVCSNYHNENPEIQIVSAIQSIYLTYLPLTTSLLPFLRTPEARTLPRWEPLA